MVEGSGKRGQGSLRRMAPVWVGGLLALLLAAGFRMTGFLEAARGVALFHGGLLLLLLGSFLPWKYLKKPANYADSFLASGLETAFFLYALGTIPEFLDGGLLLLQRGNHDPYFPVWIWGGLLFRLAGVALGLALSRSELGSLVSAPWEKAGGEGARRGRWEPPLVKAPPRAPASTAVRPLVEAVEQVTWGLAGPLGDLEDVLHGLLRKPGLAREDRERLERARAETHWCWKQVENLGKLIPGEISLHQVSSLEGEAGVGPGKEGEKGHSPGGAPGTGSLFLVHLGDQGEGPAAESPGKDEGKEEEEKERPDSERPSFLEPAG